MYIMYHYHYILLYLIYLGTAIVQLFTSITIPEIMHIIFIIEHNTTIRIIRVFM